ncbi:hypothetical protein BN940_00201 [Castellaniella defragrans 65Phen]|uniref:Uncharacterized protein n=1 Tax=Castellaniella defragrans (strain DSM 12143 / CCUG 39792 / 65Phen) TaxID=1437824 RepID=W8X0R9_CASD6|nr:hypothetical protein BN940_00201 [Castellaniella defragrans 65Phen]
MSSLVLMGRPWGLDARRTDSPGSCAPRADCFRAFPGRFFDCR